MSYTYPRSKKESAPRPYKPSPNFRDLTGEVYGRWTVLECSQRATRPGEQTRWRCRCRCGKEKPAVSFSSLTQGASKSCGCLRKGLLRRPNSIRAKNLREYGIWQGMKTRCHNAGHPTFKNYGARGITVCVEWNDSFEVFINDMGSCPEELSLERKNNDGPYNKENCIWATRMQQARNKRLWGSSKSHGLW